jgi:hypothetical protein
METKVKFKAHKVIVKDKTFEELEAEVRAINEANIQAYKEQETSQE